MDSILQMRKPAVFCLWLGFCLLLPSCSTERAVIPAGPTEPGKLPAMLITDEPVVDLWTTSVRADSADTGMIELKIEVPDSVLNAFSTLDELKVWYYRSWYLRRSHTGVAAEIYDYEQGAWQTLTAWDAGDWCASTEWSIEHYLSAFSDDLRASFLGSEGIMRVRGNIAETGVRFLRYNPSYQPIVLPQSLHVRPSALAVVNGNIWAAATYWSCKDEFPVPVDSVFIFDSTGARLGSFAAGKYKVQGLVVHDGTIWVLTDAGRAIGTIDSSGTINPLFTLPRSVGKYLWDIEWALDRLWAPGEDALLYGILPAPSVGAGEAVIDWRMALRPAHYGYGNVMWDGAYFYIRSYDFLTKFNLSREAVEQFRFKVATTRWTTDWPDHDSEIAWDGESMWMLHYGPRALRGNSLFLSRFLLP